MKLFIIVDMQKDFLTGSLANQKAVAVVDKIKEKLMDIDDPHFIDNGKYKIIATRDTHFDDNYFDTLEGKKLPVKHCVRDTDGWQVDENLRPYIDAYVDKTTFGYDKWKDFIDYLNETINDKIDEVILCGTCTSICVLANAVILRGLYPNMKITVLKDLCADVTNEAHEAALICMKSQQIDVE